MTTLETAALVALDVAVILGAARVVGSVLARVGQPRVVGEILAGFLLGPSLLGALPGDLTTELFPAEVRPALKLIGQVGLALFIFAVGLGFEAGALRRHGRTAATISIGSILLPFALGLVLAGYLHDRHDVVDSSEVPFTSFALFIGVAMSITAFPVLARILTETRLAETPLGSLALTAAAVDDVVGWSLLAVATSVASAGGDVSGEGALTMAAAAAYCLVLGLVIRPFLAERLARGQQQWRSRRWPALVLVLGGLAASAAISEALGIHFVFGSFVFGAALPRHAAPDLFEGIRLAIGPPARIAVPIFFVIPGLSLDLGAIGAHELLELGVVLAVACAGKFLGAYFSAIACNMPRREAAAIGILMNTRGLMELVVLAIGLEAGLLDDRLFTILVIMAIVTTVATTPLLRALPPRDEEWASGRGRREPGGV